MLILSKCKTVDEFIQLMDGLDCTIGRMGGRYFVSGESSQSYTMNQIVHQFTEIVKGSKPQKSDILRGCESIRKLDENELFEALNDSNNKAISNFQRRMTKIRQFVGNFVFSILHGNFKRLEAVKSLKGMLFTDKHALLAGNKPIEPSHFSWLLNLGLLRIAEESAQSEEEKEQIRFLAANFLNKSAPIQLKTWRPFFAKIDSKYEKIFETMFQVSDFDEYWYHRESLGTKFDFGKDYNKELVFGNKTPLVLMDTLECDHFFPLKFTVLNADPSSLETKTVIKNVLTEYLSKHAGNVFEKELDLPFLFDVTETLGKEMLTEGDKEKNKLFKSRFSEFKKELKSSIRKVVKEIVVDNPSLAKRHKEIELFVQKNMTCISRVEVGGIKGIKLLPIVSSSITEKEFRASSFKEFMHLTGLYFGAISLRRKMLDAFARREDISYTVPAKSSQLSTLYYPNKEDFTEGAFFHRLATLFDQADTYKKRYSSSLVVEEKVLGISKEAFEARVEELAKKPHIVVLGKATMDLLKGLMSEVSAETWSKINQNPALCQVWQLSLMMIREHLATAEMHAMSGNYVQFAQEIELVHAELAALFELAQPFEESDFEGIYRDVTRPEVPVELRSYWRGGLGKTAMNIFSGVNLAILSQQGQLQRVHDKNTYYEELDLIGTRNQMENFKNDTQIPNVNLYIGQFSPNINTDPELVEYVREDLIANVKYLLDSGRASKHLTVAVDCTIEKSPSSNVQQLLKEFKKEIAEGKLNFVIFNSGQKYDMLGMDNYYGCPFYTVNNGDVQWKTFDSLFTHPAHRTDSLSNQWFCLSKKYAADSLSKYKELIFENTRYVLDNIPKKLKPNAVPNQKVKVNSASKEMDTAFIDIKISGRNHVSKSYDYMKKFYDVMSSKGIKVYSRQSFGFYHPCCLVFDLPDDVSASTIRITLGLNPEENKTILEYLHTL